METIKCYLCEIYSTCGFAPIIFTLKALTANPVSRKTKLRIVIYANIDCKTTLTQLVLQPNKKGHKALLKRGKEFRLA